MCFSSSPHITKPYRVRAPKPGQQVLGFLLLLLGCLFQLPCHASLLPALDFNEPVEDFHNDFAWTLGFQFYTFEAVNVTSLGFYDAQRDGLVEAHAVGLWRSTGQLLATANISNASALGGWFRWEEISPVSLQADEWYVIAAFNELDDYTWNPEGVIVDSRIYFDSARYVFSESLSFPSETEWELNGFFGPNFLISNDPIAVAVTAPSSLVLVIGWFVALAGWRTLRGRQRWLAVLAVTSNLFTLPVHALDAVSQVIQGEDGEDLWAPLTDKYYRYQHPKVGAMFTYDKVTDAEGNYLVPVGEKLRWEWKLNGFPIGSTEVRYVGGENHCWVINNSQQHCSYVNKWWSLLDFRCRADSENYQVITYRNGVKEQDIKFKTERFRMYTDKSMWQYPVELKPKTHKNPDAAAPPGTWGETGLLSIRVTDDLGCGQAIANVAVEIETFVVPGSNDHDHFKDYNPGTGTFKARTGHPATIFNGNGFASGFTNANGLFQIDYQAQDFAVDERVKVHLTQTLEGGERYQVEELQWRLKWADLIEFDFAPHVWVFGGNGVCGHGSDEARSLTEAAGNALIEPLNMFTANSGGAAFLRLNDASFPWGGGVDTLAPVDNGICGLHKSHRIGIDIDINSRDTAGRRLSSITCSAAQLQDGCVSVPAGTYNGTSLEDILVDAFLRNSWVRVQEEPIHFRYQPAVPAN